MRSWRYMKVSVDTTFSMVADLGGQHREQLLVALADHLDEQVVGAGGDHHVVDLVERGDRVGDRLERPAGPDADHRLPGEAELEGVGDRDDLHHPAVHEPLHALPHRRLGEARRPCRSRRTSGGRPAGAPR